MKVKTTKDGSKHSYWGASINIELLADVESMQAKLLESGVAVSEKTAIMRQALGLWLAAMEATLEKLK